jgi:hypothetical protein
MPSKNSTKNNSQLFIVYKVRNIAWQEEGMPTTAVDNRLGGHSSYINNLLGKTSDLLKMSTLGLSNMLLASLYVSICTRG